MSNFVLWGLGVIVGFFVFTIAWLCCSMLYYFRLLDEKLTKQEIKQFKLWQKNKSKNVKS